MTDRSARLSRAAFLALALLGTAARGADDESAAFQKVVVKPGDTLWSLSQRYLEDPGRWEEILKYNRLPTSDPTVALPETTLRVPIMLVKEELRSATLEAMTNGVLFRRKDTAQWKGASLKMDLFRDDSLRTEDAANARVRFYNNDLLELGANAMAIVRPAKKDYIVELKRGGSFLGKAKIMTATAKITAKTQDTQYLATVKDDLSTVVQVVKGKADVEAGNKHVEVGAGLATLVKPGMAPGAPAKIADLPAFEKSVANFSSGKARVSLAAGGREADGARAASKDVRVGDPVSAYRLQLSESSDFSGIAFDKTYDADVKPDLNAVPLPSGRYWLRVAPIDLLGAQGKWGRPKPWVKN